jgi:ribosomal-protein-alanine N-acetyltransferase
MLMTVRCMLVSLSPQDYEDVKHLLMNPEVRRYLGGPVDEQAFRPRFQAWLSAGAGSRYWVIRQTSDRQFVGVVSLGPHHGGTSTEVSYQLLPQWWGHGYGTEVVRRVIQHAFEDLHLPRVVAETQTANKPSCRLLEKLGMQLERTVQRFGAEQAIYSVDHVRGSRPFPDRCPHGENG